MTNISYKATTHSNTLCIARFVNAANDFCHRNSAVREVFRGSQMKNFFLVIIWDYLEIGEYSYQISAK